ncbi:hypothetical protein GCM10027345_44490 [Hymenobacter daeguensis]
MALSLAPARAQRPTVVRALLNPAPNAVSASRTAPAEVALSQPIMARTAGLIALHSLQYRGVQTTFSALSTTPTSSTVRLMQRAASGQVAALKPGETVEVTIPATVESTNSLNYAVPYVYQFTAATTGGSGFFGPGADIAAAASNARLGAAVGDVDADGDLDLLTTNPAGNSVSVRLNNGSGSFSGNTTVAVGASPISVVLADVDLDGDLDLLTANNLDNTVSVRTNVAGTFSGLFRVGVGSRPQSLVVADIDGDSDLDLLTANALSNSVSVRLNTGLGGYTPSVGAEVAVGAGPSQVVMGDVDLDGDLDLLAANATDGTVSIRLNNGSGIFSGTADVAVGTSPAGLVAGDVDADGDLDFVTADAGSNSLSLCLNNGNGTFAGALAVSIGAGSSPQAVALADVDGDGDLDLLTATTGTGGGSGAVNVRLNNGRGTFSSLSDVQVGGGPGSILTGDLDADGDIDLVTPNQPGNTVSVRLNAASSPLAAAGAAAAPAFVLYPNPADRATAVQIRIAGAAGLVPATIYNALGQAVGAATLTGGAGQPGSSLPTRGLPAGIYTVRLQIGPQCINKRLELY